MKSVGDKFGRLTIIEKTDKRNGRNLIYKCQCDCGNIVEVPSNKIGIYTNSCGCLKKETSVKQCRKNEEKTHRKQMSYFGGSQITQIKSDKVYSTNKTGTRGVYFDKRSNKFIAHITVCKKKIVLGYFKNIEDAIRERQKAKEKYFNPINEKWEERKMVKVVVIEETREVYVYIDGKEIMVDELEYIPTGLCED